MGRKNQTLSAGLIVLVLVVAVVGSALHRIGGGGVIAIGLLIIVGVVWYSRGKRSDFQQLAMETLTTQQHWQDEKSLNRALAKENMTKAQLIRLLQIMRESISIAITSNKRDTAESRMELVRKHAREINANFHLRRQLTEETLNFVNTTVADAEKRYHTALYVNTATAHIEKSRTLKTVKSRIKYLNLAREVIAEGMLDPSSDKSILCTLQERIDGLLNPVEVE